MDSAEEQSRLSQIETQWSLLRQAHVDDPGWAADAQAALLERYRGAMFRYLLAVSGDADVAEELMQEFAVRFLRGDYKGASPDRGRFRSYLKSSILHLVSDYWRREAGRRAKERLLDPTSESIEELTSADSEQKFDESWRHELLSRTWDRLKELERAHGQPYYQVMSLRSAAPELDSTGLAQHLSRMVRREPAYTPEAVRKLLQRARMRFSELLLAEVAASIHSDRPEDLESELIASGLWSFCREVLKARPRQ